MFKTRVESSYVTYFLTYDMPKSSLKQIDLDTNDTVRHLVNDGIWQKI